MKSSSLAVQEQQRILATLKKQLRLVKVNVADQFTMQLIETKVRTASNQLKDGTFGRCTCCSKDITIGILEKDPSQPYCKDCDENFSRTKDLIEEKLSSSRKSLFEVEKNIRFSLASSERTIGKDPGEVVVPDISTERFRINYLRKDIEQCEEVLLAMASGKYEGICQSCEEPLEERRLKAKPHAKLCTECAGNIEKGRKNFRA